MQIDYVGAHGTDHLFHILSDGDRPVLEIYVDEKDCRIRINGYGAPLDDIQATKGTTHIDDVIVVEDGVPQGVTRMPCVAHIAEYVLPRAFTVMARVYLPKVKA